MNSLFDTSIKFNDFVKRNIVFIQKPQLAFSSISDNIDDISAILAASEFARNSVCRKNGLNDFYYTAAIGYPFQTKPFMSTRYSDGSYPVWYGSNTIETTIHETVNNTFHFLNSEDGTFTENKIVKKRSIFDVFCNAFLVDLRSKVKKYPEIISDNYEFSHKIGKEARQGGLPGILSPSARHRKGTNFIIFNEAVLKSPEFLMDLTYTFLPQKKRVEITGFGETIEIKL